MIDIEINGIGIGHNFVTLSEAPEFMPNCRCVMMFPECDIEDSPKYWDVKASPVYPDESPDDYQIRKWLSQVSHGGMVGDKAVVIVYNEEHPSQSLVIVEETNNL